MPVLKQGSSGDVVRSLQRISNKRRLWPVGNDTSGHRRPFGPHTAASVKAFQGWGGVTADGIVGDQTWSVSLHAASATLETAVGLTFVVDD